MVRYAEELAVDVPENVEESEDDKPPALVILLFFAEEVATSTGLTSANESAGTFFESGGNPSLLGEPMPFTLPVSHSDTSVELADMSVSPLKTCVDDGRTGASTQSGFGQHAGLVHPWRDQGADPRVRKRLERIGGARYPGILTDEDIWSKTCDKATHSLSTKEELFFGTPTELPSERRHRLRHGRPESQLPMFTDEWAMMQFPGIVCAALDAPGADDTMLNIDADLTIQRRIRTEPSLLTEFATDEQSRYRLRCARCARRRRLAAFVDAGCGGRVLR